MDSLSFPSRPLQKPRVRVDRERDIFRSFFLLSFFFFFLLSCPVLSTVCSLVSHFKNFLFTFEIAFCRKRFPSAESVIQFKRESKNSHSPISRSRRPALSRRSRAVSGTDERSTALTSVLINYSYRQL